MRYSFFLLVFLAFSSYGQKTAPKGFIQMDKTPENVESVMAYSRPSLRQLDSLIQLGRNYTNANRDTALMLIEKAIELSRPIKEKAYQKQYGRALSSKGVALSSFGENEKSVNAMILADSIFKKVDHKLGQASVDRFLGSHYLQMGNLEQSATHYLNSIELYKKTSVDPRAFVGPYEGLYNIYFNIGDFEKAQLYLTEAIVISDSTDMAYKESPLRVSQSLIFYKLGDKYKNIADTTLKDIKIYRDSSDLFYQKGLAEAKLAVQAAKNIKDKSFTINSLQVLAKIQNKIKDFKSAKTTSEEAHKLAKDFQSPIYLAQIKINLANALFGLKNYTKAQSMANTAVKLSGEYKLDLEKVNALDILLKSQLKTRAIDTALITLEEKNKLEKQLNSTATKKAITDAETKYRTAEKENKILIQENDILELETKNANFQKQKNNLISGGILLSLFGFFLYQINKVRRERNDKKQFAEALLFAQEEERKRIGRDLHDGIGHSLLLIKKQLNENQNVSLENQTMITEALDEVRAISRDLHPIQLEKFGLTKSIESLVEKVSNSTKIFITKEIDNIDTQLESKSEIHLFRAIQEAFNNIIRHAEATAAKIEVKLDTNDVNIVIKDNGKGFDYELMIAKFKSLGLRTMSERIDAIGGTLRISKSESGGIMIKITIPRKV